MDKIENQTIKIEKVVNVKGEKNGANTNNKTKNTTMSPDVICVVTAVDEIFHVFQWQNNINYPSGNLEFEAKVFIALLVKEYGIKEDSYTIRDSYINDLAKYYHNYNDPALRANAITAVTLLGYTEGRYVFDHNHATKANLVNINQIMEIVNRR